MDARVSHSTSMPEQLPGKRRRPYVIRGTELAKGGEAINELATVCSRAPNNPPWVCQFSGYPGTVGWKTGFRYLRDEVLSGPPVSARPGRPVRCARETCVRRFDRNRHDTFHYALFGHAIGLPKSDKPCLDEAGDPVGTNGDDGSLRRSPSRQPRLPRATYQHRRRELPRRRHPR